MHKKILGCMLVLALAALVSAGCAKKDVVKSEEPVAAQTQTAPAESKAASEQAKAEPAAAGKAEPTVEATKEQAVKQEAQAQAPAAQLQAGLQAVYFAFDSSTLSEEARTGLTKNADFLKTQGAKVKIEGNCDERGSDDYNLALGERRAKAAKDYLVNLGIPADRLSTISYGKEKPAVDGHDEAAWSKNRRDDFVIVK